MMRITKRESSSCFEFEAAGRACEAADGWCMVERAATFNNKNITV